MFAFLAVVIGLGVLTRMAIDKGESKDFKNLKEYDAHVGALWFGKKGDPRK
jgi:hypothetical protein